MLQVSLLGFAVGGAFLSLAYFDVPYYVMAAMIATRLLVEQHLKAKAALARRRVAGVQAAGRIVKPQKVSNGLS